MCSIWSYNNDTHVSRQNWGFLLDIAVSKSNKVLSWQNLAKKKCLYAFMWWWWGDDFNSGTNNQPPCISKKINFQLVSIINEYPATTITDADYADDIAILANTPDQAETLLHSLERAAANIGLYVNAHKTEYMCYNQTGDISTLEGTPLKLVDKFTYLGSSVESTEKDIETRLAKAWTAINRLSIIWK